MERSDPLKAAAWMMGAVVSFVAMAVAGREILVAMNTFELMLYRSAIGLVVAVLLIGRSRRGFAQVRSARMDLHLKRNLFHFTGQNLWFFAVTAIPLSQLVALEFTNPIWVALLAPFLLGERLTRARVAGALLGFARGSRRGPVRAAARSGPAMPRRWRRRSASRSTPSSPSRSCGTTACSA